MFRCIDSLAAARREVGCTLADGGQLDGRSGCRSLRDGARADGNQKASVLDLFGSLESWLKDERKIVSRTNVALGFVASSRFQFKRLLFRPIILIKKSRFTVNPIKLLRLSGSLLFWQEDALIFGFLLRIGKKRAVGQKGRPATPTGDCAAGQGGSGRGTSGRNGHGGDRSSGD